MRSLRLAKPKLSPGNPRESHIRHDLSLGSTGGGVSLDRAIQNNKRILLVIILVVNILEVLSVDGDLRKGFGNSMLVERITES